MPRVNPPILYVFEPLGRRDLPIAEGWSQIDIDWITPMCSTSSDIRA